MAIVVQTALISSSFVGGWEIVLILAVLLILIAARRLPDLRRGLGEGLREFLKVTRSLQQDLDERASDAGKSLGGIYGKPAHEALTADNQTAELYDPAVLRQNKTHKRFFRSGRFQFLRQLCRRIWNSLCRLLTGAH